MAQAYYRKWRPMGWGEVIGQEHVIRTLRNAFGQENITHAYLFSGPRGTGKTTTARIIAKAVNCLAEDPAARPCNGCEPCLDINQGRFLDLIEIDAASNTSVDDVRDLRGKINFSPTRGRFKVYIIDEVHMLSNAAFNALLKTLEEPPSHAIFILATTEVHKIPATVLSRCQRHEFRRIPLNFIQAQLKSIAEQEGITVDPVALTAIARQATGSMRDAISLLDQLASTGVDVDLEMTKQVLGTAAGQSVYELIGALLEGRTGAGISIINKALDRGSDPRQYGRQIVNSLRSVLMVKMGNADQIEATVEESEKLKEYAGRFPLRKLLTAIRAFDRAAQHTNAGWQPGLQLELAVARTIESGDGESDGDYSESKETGFAHQPAQRKFPKRGSGSPKAESIKIEKPAGDDKPNSGDIEIEVKQEKAAKSEVGLDENGSSVDADINQIKSAWKEIRDAAKEISPETGALLNSSRSMNLRRGRLVLGFASELLSSKMKNGRNIENARKAIQQICGADVQIDCQVAGNDESPVPDGIEVNRDGMVGEALSLGGKITKKE